MADAITFEQFRAEWLGDIRAGAPSTTALGHRFAHKILSQWLDFGEGGGDEPVYCDGAGDGGIDVAYLDRKENVDADAEQATGDTWYLVQSKYGTAFRGTATLIEEGQKVIDSLDGKRTRLSSLTAGLLERLVNFRKAASERDRVTLVFATEEPLTEEQKRALDDLRSMGVGRLGPVFSVDSISLETIYKRSQESTPADEPRIRVSLEAALVGSGPDLLVGSTPIIHLYEFLKRYRKTTQDLDQLYERNVRRFLGGKGKVNRKMQDTLLNRPEKFGLFNNGITITVADFQSVADGYELVEPYVVNGCQTTRTIWEVCQTKLEAGGTGGDQALSDWQAQLHRGVVVTKVVRVGTHGEGLLQEITRYTNTQNAVREKDFLTLTNDFRTWGKQMAERYEVFLEVQRGGWESRRAFQKQHPAEKKFEASANAFDLLKAYGSGWLREPGLAFGRNAAFLPKGSVFERIIAPSETPFGVDDLYAAYRLHAAADQYGFGRRAADDKPGRRQTRFLFYLVANDLLRHVMTHAQMPTRPEAITAAWTRLF